MRPRQSFSNASHPLTVDSHTFSCFSTILVVDRPSSYQVSCFLTSHSVLAQNCLHITSLGLATCMNQFSGLGTWAMADAESDTGWNKPLWSSLKFPQRSAPQSPFPGLHGHLCCRHLSNLSRHWLGGRWPAALFPVLGQGALSQAKCTAMPSMCVPCRF